MLWLGLKIYTLHCNVISVNLKLHFFSRNFTPAVIFVISCLAISRRANWSVILTSSIFSLWASYVITAAAMRRMSQDTAAGGSDATDIGYVHCIYNSYSCSMCHWQHDCTAGSLPVLIFPHVRLSPGRGPSISRDTEELHVITGNTFAWSVGTLISVCPRGWPIVVEQRMTNSSDFQRTPETFLLLRARRNNQNIACSLIFFQFVENNGDPDSRAWEEREGKGLCLPQIHDRLKKSCESCCGRDSVFRRWQWLNLSRIFSRENKLSAIACRKSIAFDISGPFRLGATQSHWAGVGLNLDYYIRTGKCTKILVKNSWERTPQLKS